jgi:hypothetical protein
MGFELEKIVPWGRNFGEYRRMFSLSDADLSKRILGAGDGPASFNAEATEQGSDVISIDPLYGYSGEEIRSRFDEIREEVLAKTAANAHQFVWDVYPNVEALGAARVAATRRFLEDFDDGLSQGRYVAGELPNLPVAEDTRDLALVSHLLFLYSAPHLDLQFHIDTIQDLLRVAPEVRIFPLTRLDGARSEFVEPVTQHFSGPAGKAELVKVDYEFHRGGNWMMRVRRAG